MITVERPEAAGLQLRCLAEADITERYVAWLNDPVVNRALEVRFHPQTLASTRAFVRDVNASVHSILFGIFVDGGRVHIGNIKLGPIDRCHSRADIGLLIGDREQWGRGHATRAIATVTDYAFANHGLQKLTAGCYAGNAGSQRAFEKAGYRVEGRLASHWQTAVGREDGILLGMTRELHAEIRAARASQPVPK